MARTLTRDEARERAALLDVRSYTIELDLTGLADGTRFASTTTVRLRCSRPGATTFLELDGELLSLERAGVQVTPNVVGNRIVLADLAAEEAVRVVARCTATGTGEGLHRAVDPADGEVYVYAQAFLDDAQRIFACFDQPDLKAPVQLTVRAPEGWRVLANARGELVGDRWVFATTEPLATYLVTLAAGRWHGEQREHEGVMLGVWCRRSLAASLEADELFTITRAALGVQQEVFGSRYPFGDTYDQVFVPDFSGAMENPGMVTFSDEQFIFRSRATEGQRRLRAQVMAHEMAHMWFGDLVTMRWWDDLWLNESFAEMLGLHTVEQTHRAGLLPWAGAWADFCLGRKAWGYRADQLPTTHPVAGDVADNRTALLNFDGISYAKGASVLRQLSAWLGEEVFFEGVRGYLREHAWGNTGWSDLVTALERASGRDLQDWARVWLRTSGVPVLRVTGGELLQEADVLRPHLVGVGLYDDDDGVLRRRERLDLSVSDARTPLDAPAAALVLPNDGDLTYAKVRLDPDSLAVALARTGDVADPLARAVLWGALWDTTRDGELPTADLVRAVLAGLPAERDPDVLQTLLDQARRAATLWSRDRAGLLAAVHEACCAGVEREEPDSDLQLVHWRAATGTATDPGLLERWLAGELPRGVITDADQRWLLVGRLAALGAADPALIEAELARDRTAGGHKHAAAAVAARPDAAAKAAVWDELVGEGELTTGRARALAGGFWQAGQEDLLRPYARRWAEQVPLVFERRSPQLATGVARLLFPSLLVEPATLEATDLRGELPAGLRRVLLEERDELGRALRARER